MCDGRDAIGTKSRESREKDGVNDRARSQGRTYK